MTQCTQAMMKWTHIAVLARRGCSWRCQRLCCLPYFFSWLCSARSSRGGFPPPPVMLANVYSSDTPLADYLVSEKLDGYALLGRRKAADAWRERIEAPAGSLQGGRISPGRRVVGRRGSLPVRIIVRQRTPDTPPGVRCVSWCFDLPAHPEPSLNATRR